MALLGWTLCTSGTAIAKAGTHANSTIVASGTLLLDFSKEAEGSMELETGMALVDNVTGLANGIQSAMADVCSSKIAMKIIAYDTTGYLSREADTLLNVNDDIITKGYAKLKDFKKMTLNKPY